MVYSFQVVVVDELNRKNFDNSWAGKKIIYDSKKN